MSDNYDCNLHFSARCSVYFVCPSVLSLRNLKQNKIQPRSEVKNIFMEEKLILRLTLNRGLALTGFRTTPPEAIKNNKTILNK